MASYKTYLIGRGRDADITLGDDTVSRSHAELVCASGADAYLTDRMSSGGTFVFRDGAWHELRQSWIGTDERLRFGDLEIDARRLLEMVPRQRAAVTEPDSLRPRGRVARNPITGEIESRE